MPPVAEVVGRERELESIAAFLNGSECGTLLLEGDAGIGKTTLWRTGVELARRAGYRIVQAAPAEAERDLSYAALSDLAAPLRGRIAELPAPQRSALQVALLVEEPAGVPPDRRAVGAALTSLFGEVAERQRLVVAIDDLQWLDAASAAALSFALRRLDHPGLRVLAARRAGESSMELDPCERLGIGPLQVRDLDLLLRRRLGVSFVAPVLETLAETSGGNPLYALELARELRQRDQPLRPGEPLPVPDGLRSLLATRFGRLPPRTRKALAVAAMLRQPTLDVVEAAVGGRFDSAVAEAAGVITVDGDVVRFRHPLFASAVYGALAMRATRGLHRRLAEIVDDVEERARHLAAAASGPDEAIAVLLDGAAGVAASRGAPTNALTLAERALELTPDNSPARVNRQLAAARARFDAGDAAGAKTAFATLAGSLDGRDRARALLQLGLVVAEVDGLGASIPIYRSALELPEEVVGASLAGLAHARLAQALAVEDEETAMQHAELAVERADRGHEAAALGEALAVLAQLRYGRERVVQAELLERALSLQQEGHVWANNNPILIYGLQHLDAGIVERASPLLERAVAAARERRDPSLNFALVYLAWRDVRIGETRRAIEVANEARVSAQLAGRDEVAIHALAPAAVAESIVGDEEACRRDVAEMNAHGESRPAADFALGLLELSLENWGAAVAVHRAGLEAVHPTSRLSEVPGLVEGLLGLGRTKEARSVVAREWPAAVESLPPSVATARLWHALAVLLAAERDDDGASAAFARSFAIYDAITANPVHRGRVVLSLGIVLRRARRRREARERLEAARAAFESCDAAVWARRAEAELAVLGGRPRSPGKLTPSEQRIADLVARGRSNDEVARDVHLSPKTVEWNLTKIYRKLSVASRAELAAKLARRQLSELAPPR